MNETVSKAEVLEQIPNIEVCLEYNKDSGMASENQSCLQSSTQSFFLYNQSIRSKYFQVPTEYSEQVQEQKSKSFFLGEVQNSGEEHRQSRVYSLWRASGNLSYDESNRAEVCPFMTGKAAQQQTDADLWPATVAFSSREKLYFPCWPRWWSGYQSSAPRYHYAWQTRRKFLQEYLRSQTS